MTTVKDHLNKDVITTSDGKNLGKIKEIYFDSRVKRVTAISLGSHGIIHRKHPMIERAKVKMYGIDTLTVLREEDVVEQKSLDDFNEFVPASELKGRQIISEGGTEIATIDSVIIDDEGYVTGFTLDKIPESGPIASRKAIARDAISSIGSNDSPMVTTLAEAETMEIST